MSSSVNRRRFCPDIATMPPQSVAPTRMGFALTTLGFASLEGAFYAYVQSTAPVARRSCVCDATR